MCRSVCVCLSVGRSVRKVYCGKTAVWIGMPFGVARWGRSRIGVLDGDGDCRRGRGRFWGEFGAYHCKPTGTLRRSSSRITLSRICSSIIIMYLLLFHALLQSDFCKSVFTGTRLPLRQIVCRFFDFCPMGWIVAPIKCNSEQKSHSCAQYFVVGGLSVKGPQKP